MECFRGLADGIRGRCVIVCKVVKVDDVVITGISWEGHTSDGNNCTVEKSSKFCLSSLFMIEIVNAVVCMMEL